MATRKGGADKRDAALLHISQRLAETDGKITPAAMLRELKASGQGYRKTEFLKDFSGVKGSPQQKPTPGQIRGGLVSGVMRRKDVKALPKAQQDQVKKVAKRAIDKIAESGENPRRNLKIVTVPGKTLAVYEQADWEEVENLPDGAEVLGNINVATIEQESLPVMLDVMESLFDKLT